MSTDLQSAEKAHIRATMQEKRKLITAARRKEATQKAFTTLQELLIHHTLVLSYSSFDSELETTSLNGWLQKQGKLVLPRVEGSTLTLFHVTTPLETVLPHNSWNIAEPDPSLCRKINPGELSCALIPAIAFDSRHHRLGYGKGFYDQLLASMPPSIPTYGLGFHEQYLHDPLPIAPHDISLSALLLF